MRIEDLFFGKKRPNFTTNLGLVTVKGQLISKANCQAEDSSKKRTNELVFTSMQRLFVCFLEESAARNKTFRDYMTFRHLTYLNVASSSTSCIVALHKHECVFLFLWILKTMQIGSSFLNF